MNWFKKLSVGMKLGAGFGFVCILLVVLAWRYQSTLVHSQTEYAALIDGPEKAKFHAVLIDMMVHEMVIEEQNFDATMNLDHVAELDKIYAGAKAEMEDLKKIQAAMGDRDGMASVDEMGQFLNNYKKIFHDMVKVDEEKGLTPETGLRGAFRGAAHEMEKLALNADVEELYTALLQIRRSEKDYFLRGDDKYLEKVANEIKFFRQVLSISTISSENKAQHSKNMDEYERSFASFTTDSKAGKKADETASKFRGAAHLVEAAITSNYVPSLKSSYLMMRRHEKDYQLRGDQKYVSKVKDEAEILRGHINESECSVELKTVLKQKLDAYLAAFNSMVEKDLALLPLEEAALRERDQLVRISEKIEEDMERNATAVAEATKANIEKGKTQAMVTALIALFAAVGFAVLLTRAITKPINKVIDALTSGGEQVASASSQVSQSSQQMANGASEQASSLEETSSSLEEIASTTRQNADNARQANALAAGVRKNADNGNSAMRKMSSAIQQIASSSNETAKIVKTIDTIAFQTNLLALNAAVEAARAGEAGKGFAVVAEEVRSLAQRSAEAAQTTSDLISEAQKNAENGVGVVDEVAGILNQITEGVGKVSDLISEVSAASDEQARGIDQVNAAVAQMDKVTQSNAANAEESASASEELSAQANELREMVQTLVQIVSGRTAQTSFGDHRQTSGFSNRRPATFAVAPRQQMHKAHPPAAVSNNFSAAKPEAVIPFDDDDFSDF